MGPLLRKMAIYSNIAAQSWSLLLQISSALGARASEIFTNGCSTPARPEGLVRKLVPSLRKLEAHAVGLLGLRPAQRLLLHFWLDE
jgi:hypothetical protein